MPRPTFTEQARRAQLVGVTIELIARHGYASTSLQRIADAAGITKAAVIYHFASKDALVRAAYETVIEGLTTHVGGEIARATSPAAAVDAYVTGLVGYLGDHPTHVRVIVEALDDHNATGIEDRPLSAARWKPLADLVDAAVAAGEYRSQVDSRLLAIILNGAIDAVVGQALVESSFDLGAATATILEMLHRTARR